MTIRLSPGVDRTLQRYRRQKAREEGKMRGDIVAFVSAACWELEAERSQHYSDGRVMKLLLTCSSYTPGNT